MAKSVKFLPPVKNIQLADVPGAPSWFESYLGIENRILSYLYTAFDGGITLGGNIQGTTRETELRTQSDYTSGEFDVVRLNVSPVLSQVQAVDVIQIYDLDAPTAVMAGPVQVRWIADGADIVINWVTGLEASRRYFVRFHIW